MMNYAQQMVVAIPTVEVVVLRCYLPTGAGILAGAGIVLDYLSYCLLDIQLPGLVLRDRLDLVS